MKILLQRVAHARVSVEGAVVGSIANGLLLLVGFGTGDSDKLLRPMAEKVLNLRLFPQGEKSFHLSSLEANTGALLVPQFTLYAEVSKGRRPDFFGALEPALATSLFDSFVQTVRSLATGAVATGQFGAHMHVELLNDGPVTIMLDSRELGLQP